MWEKSKGAWHYFSIIELFLLPVRFSLLKYLLWENTAIIRWPPPLLPLICSLSFHELDINVSKAILFIQRFLNVTEYSEAVAKNYCSLRTHDCRFKFETQVAATTNGVNAKRRSCSLLGSLRIDDFFLDDDFRWRHRLCRRRFPLRAKFNLRVADVDAEISSQI